MNDLEDIELPEAFDGDYLPEFFFDLWPTRSTGMSETATDWDVILPYALVKGLDHEDAELLAVMCKAYLTSKREGIHPLAISPMDLDQERPQE